MTADAERLRAMAACLGEVCEALPACSLRTVAEGLLKEYRASRPDTRTGLAAAFPPPLDEEDQDSGRSCGCSDEEPCDRHNPWSGRDQGGDVDGAARDIRGAGRGR